MSWRPNIWQRCLAVFGAAVFWLGAFSRLTSYDGADPVLPFVLGLACLAIALAPRAKKPADHSALIAQAVNGFNADLDRAMLDLLEFKHVLLGIHAGVMDQQAAQGPITDDGIEGAIMALRENLDEKLSEIRPSFEQRFYDWAILLGNGGAEIIADHIAQRLGQLRAEILAEARGIAVRKQTASE